MEQEYQKSKGQESNKAKSPLEKKGKESITFEELSKECERAVSNIKEADKVWKELKKDKTSTEEERIEGMKKINHIVGSNDLVRN